MFQRLRSCWQMCVSCDCASGCVLVSTHTYLSTRCRHEWRWREVGLFDRGSPTLEEKRREGAQRGQQKKCFKAHWPRLWSPPPLRAPLSPCGVAMWEKKMVLSASPSSFYLPSVTSLAAPILNARQLGYHLPHRHRRISLYPVFLLLLLLLLLLPPACAVLCCGDRAGWYRGLPARWRDAWTLS